MILGIGNDVIEITRVGHLLSGKTGDKFFNRILTLNERQLAYGCQARKVEFVTGRFAAKEAIVKALGCGIGALVGFQDIDIIPDGKGKPVCTLSSEAMQRLGLGATTITIHVSISHSTTMVSAFAVVERIE